MPDAAKICNSPELTKESLMFLGGDTASSPKTIPPIISKFGDGKYFECNLRIFSL